MNANLYHCENLKPDAEIQFIVIRFPAAARDFFLLQSIQTCSGAHRASYLVGTKGTLPWGKEARV
jgi:hypothetical protein